jgi:hypothetical protein
MAKYEQWARRSNVSCLGDAVPDSEPGKRQPALLEKQQRPFEVPNAPDILQNPGSAHRRYWENPKNLSLDQKFNTDFIGHPVKRFTM